MSSIPYMVLFLLIISETADATPTGEMSSLEVGIIDSQIQFGQPMWL